MLPDNQTITDVGEMHVLENGITLARFNNSEEWCAWETNKTELFDGSWRAIVIPDQYQGMPVTRIADRFIYRSGAAFNRTSGHAYTDRPHSCELVILGDSIEYIGEGAFAYCKELKQIGTLSSNLRNLPKKLTRIGACAFKATRLESLVLPTGVTHIESNALEFCEHLGEIDISGIKTIGDYAFAHSMRKPTRGEMYNNKEREIFEDVHTGELLYAEPIGFFYLNGITIDLQAVEIGVGAFEGCNAWEINLQGPIEAILPNTFAECKYLSDVVLPSSIDYIDPSAFLCSSDCDGVPLTLHGGNSYVAQYVDLLNSFGMTGLYYEGPCGSA